MKFPFIKFVLSTVVFTVIISCGAQRTVRNSDEGVDVIVNADGSSDRYALSSLNIPFGQLPPPGECKIWYPELPAGHQPPPQDCQSAIMNRPRGALIVTHQGTVQSPVYRVVEFLSIKGKIEEIVRYYSDKF